MARKILGLDFGDVSIVGVEITRRGRRRVVTALGEAPMPPGTILGGKILDKQSLQKTLARLLQDNAFSAKSTVLGVDGTSVTVKTLRLPIMNERELEKALEFELPEAVNFPIQSLKDVSYDYYENERTASEIEVVLVACQRSLLDPYIQTARQVGLIPEVIDVPALNWSLIPLQERSRAFVDIQENWTTIFVELGAIFKILRIVPIGRIHFQQGVEEAFQCSAGEAQKLCATKHIDYLLLEGAGNKSVLRANTQQFVNAVFQTLDYLRAQNRASRFAEVLDELVLLGRMAHLQGLCEVLREEVDLPIYTLDPFLQMALEPSVAPPDNAAAYGSALALALRGS